MGTVFAPIAGLVAARICSDHFERVIIVEPEAWLSAAQGRLPQAWMQQHARSRVIQYDQNQSTQVLNYLALSKLFPTFDDECQVSDLRVLPAEVKTSFSGLLPLDPSPRYGGVLPKTFYGSRRGVETLLRRLVFSGNYPSIEQVTGIVTGVNRHPSDPSKLCGVSVRSELGDVLNIDAAFVVDCTGPSHLSLKWLQTAGYLNSSVLDHGSVPFDKLRIQYDQKMRVVTLRFIIPDSLGDRLPIPGGFRNIATIYNCLADWMLDNQNIYAQRVDVQILCCNWDGPKPPETLDGAIQFAKSMRVNRPIPDWFFVLLDMLHEVEDMMTSSYVRVPPCSYVRYHLATDLPRNWIAIGDSVMKINPADGQGCAKATIGAITLNTLFHALPASRKDPDVFGNFSKEFFEAQKDKIESLWSGTKLVDYGFKSTLPVAGEQLSEGSWLRWYLRRLNQAATHVKLLFSVLIS
ncbi:hypothetical protein H0H92_011210 [Tricholoma furcatifolium]|nr:hypothetical protein H0H92_011210 [Tricholoma furcatifolium]